MFSIKALKNKVIQGVTGLFMAAASPAMAELDIQTYATPETLDALGAEVAARLPAWSGDQPVVVLNSRDFEGKEITARTLENRILELTGLSEINISGNAYQRDYPLEDILLGIAEKTENFRAAAYVFENFCLIVDGSSPDDTPLSNYARTTSIDPALFENVPGTMQELNAFTNRHEAGHCMHWLHEDHTTSMRGNILTEAWADQHAVYIEHAERDDPAVTSTSFIARDYILARILGDVHGYSRSRTHSTTTNIFFPDQTIIPELQTQTIFDDEDLNVIAPLRIAVTRYIDDPEVWYNGIVEYGRGAVIGEGLTAQDLLLTNSFEYSIPENTRRLVLDNYQQFEEHLGAVREDPNFSYEDFLGEYGFRPDVIDAIREKTGRVYSTFTPYIRDGNGGFTRHTTLEDITVIRNYTHAAHNRLQEVPQNTVEGRFLSKYLEAVENFFPYTYADVMQERQTPVLEGGLGRIVFIPAPTTP